jgi:threonylcarbamoyladenosine tRNA methylthiotransferase MtaB
MARRGKTAEFEALVDRARSEIPLFNVTTDLIVGFPGETPQEWAQTLDFVERIGFGHVHVFPFSPRAGTKAARLPDAVAEPVKRARSREMHELAASMKQKALHAHVGQSQDVLWEGRNELGVLSGYTPFYHRIESRDGRLQPAQLRAVRIGAVHERGDRLVMEDPLAPL